MLVSYSVTTLNRICKKKEIWCWGCGRRFHEMISFYAQEPFIAKIVVLIDQNPALWNKTVRVGNHELSVQAWEQVKRKRSDMMILIASDSYREIYCFIREQCGDSQIVCCRYPQNYYSYTALIQKLFYYLPTRRQFLFRAGKEPHENALAVVSYLEKEYRGKAYRIVFLGNADRAMRATHSGINCLDEDILRGKNGFAKNIYFCWLYAVSAALLYENQPIPKGNRKQFLIYLNHGTIPLKDVHDVLKQPEEVDYGICPSVNCAEIYQKQYGIPQRKLFYTLPPRCGFLKNGTGKIRRIVDFDDEQIVIWLPTFRNLAEAERQDSLNDNPIFLFREDREWQLLDERLAGNHQILLIKMHSREKYQCRLPQKYAQIMMLTDDMLAEAGLVLHEILGDTAALITDYSGIAFEYLFLDKPIGYMTADMEEYRRGFAFDDPLPYMPGEKMKVRDDFFRFLDNVKKGTDPFCHDRTSLKLWLFQKRTQESGARDLISLIETRRG